MSTLYQWLMVAAFLSLCVEATAQFSVSAQVRPRTEMRKGYRIPQSNTDAAAFFFSQRTRLGVGYEHDIIQLKISMQDVRTWGEEVQLADAASFSLHEAWARIKVADSLYIQPGRQEIIFDDHRLMGSVDWAQQARSHDAVLLQLRKSHWTFDAGGAFNQLRESLTNTHYTPVNYKALLLLHAAYHLRKIKWSLTAISDGFERSDSLHSMRWRHTYGGFIQINKSPWSATLSAYGQNGKTPADQRIRAFMVNIKCDVQAGPLKLSLGTDYLSGNKSGHAQVFKAFNTLYATNHKFYGYMDYYINIPSDSRNGGLTDLFGGVSFAATEQIRVETTFHQFWSGKARPSSPTSNLGQEVDVQIIYNIRPYLSFQAGGSIYHTTKGTAYIKGIHNPEPVAGWGWLMLNISPEIFVGRNRQES